MRPHHSLVDKSNQTCPLESVPAPMGFADMLMGCIKAKVEKDIKREPALLAERLRNKRRRERARMAKQARVSGAEAANV